MDKLMKANLDKQITEIISATSPRVAEILINEQKRQERNFELIASENYPSAAVRAVLASCAGNKYADYDPSVVSVSLEEFYNSSLVSAHEFDGLEFDQLNEDKLNLFESTLLLS